MTYIKRALFSIILFFALNYGLLGQCYGEIDGIIWKGSESKLSYADLAAYAAPMLWFSPDEQLLYDDSGRIQLPQAFPFEKVGGPLVYYKVRFVYKDGRTRTSNRPQAKILDNGLLDLNATVALDLDFYYYFEKETGLGSHDHDIESITLQIQIHQNPRCETERYAISIKKVTARAHGLVWYNNTFRTDAHTVFPLSILIEEGKHASSTDKNADGVFTPGYDVDQNVNDAWGVRDIITTGRLFSGGFQGWMAKVRKPESILFPPTPKNSIHYQAIQKKMSTSEEKPNIYELRPYPNYPEVTVDKKLKRLMKNKKPHVWPKVEYVGGNASVSRWSKERKAFKSLGVAYRWDDSRSFSFSFPLLFFKNVEAPMTGGWLSHKLYFAGIETKYRLEYPYEKLLGYQMIHNNSASRWIDSYIGFGVELHDLDLDPDVDAVDFETEFVSEVGLKFRVNISKTPLRFLKFLGTDFWGVRFGWKNVGFHPNKNSGFVLEIGAGAF